MISTAVRASPARPWNPASYKQVLTSCKLQPVRDLAQAADGSSSGEVQTRELAQLKHFHWGARWPLARALARGPGAGLCPLPAFS